MKEDAYKMSGDNGEPEIVATAIPSNEPAVPAGHQRFYCSKCRTVRTTGKRGISTNRGRGAFCPSFLFHFLLLTNSFLFLYYFSIIQSAIRFARPGHVLALYQLYGI